MSALLYEDSAMRHSAMLHVVTLESTVNCVFPYAHVLYRIT